MTRKRRYKVREHQLYTVRPRVWNRLRKENKIDAIYKFRARKIEFLHRLFMFPAWLQSAIYSRRIREISFKESPPVFILGLWRSGTTHLHYLMARDPQFGILNNHQAFTFNMSLLSFNKLNRIINIFLPGKRPQDNVKVTLDEPAEEEQPFCTITHRSSIHSFYFPRNQSYFRKYHLFEGTSEKDKKGWKSKYLWLLKNIRFYNKKDTLLLKNPHNTGRIKELLELFPDAKFIYLHRDPYNVFSSTKKLYYRMISSQFLQFVSKKEIETLILENNAAILQKYLRERVLIPEGNLVEVGYDELVKDPLAILDKIYKDLNLQGLDEAMPGMKEYLASVKNYKKNTYRRLPEPIILQINAKWKSWFDEFGYEAMH
ncbi:sulfotransferase [Bacteroidota bacterium]